MSFFASSWKRAVILWLMLLSLGFVHSYMVDGEFGPRVTTSRTYKYERSDEVNKECAFVLDSASELKNDDDDDNRIYKRELSFMNGDWWQVSDGAPLMPFDDREILNKSWDLRSPSNLVSFWVSNIDRAHRSKKFVRVSGILQIGITLDSLFSSKPYERSPRFDIWPGQSQLSVIFEGVYTESKKSQGERVMCLLGSTMLPSRQQDSSDPWAWVKESGYTNQPPLMQDDRILLVLHYPGTNTLTNRAILGTMKSLNPKSSFKYFDEVHMSSWLGTSSIYEFGSEKFVSKACDPYPYKDSLSTDINTYKGQDFCYILQRFTHQEALIILPNWKCNGKDDFCSQLGPFKSDKEIKATDGGFKDVKLVLQDVRCDRIFFKDNVTVTTRVSSMFRVVSPFENQFTAAQKTGLSNMTLSAEGIWESSSGQLCMVGCRGLVGAESTNCDSRICLYVPLSFSITQRSIITGHFSSLNGSSRPYFPLSFEKLVRPVELWGQYTASRPYYKYSKIDAAAVVLEKNEPFNFGSMFKRSLLTFPKLEDADSFLVSLSILSEDLTLHTAAVAADQTDSAHQRFEIEMEILSLGPMFGPVQNGSIGEKVSFYHAKAEYTEKQLLLNVSAHLSFTGTSYNISSLFVEGLYDPRVGKMYLIGCRDVRASWKVLSDSMDLEAGLDCLIEAVITYPPTTARWLVNPAAKISVSSQRTEDDPLYFKPVNFQTFPIMYRKQREDILSRRGVEGILRILTLSLAIFCIFSQLLYIRDNAESVPYVSLSMLGVQALGYSLPLVTGAEALFKLMGADINETPSYDLDNSQWIRLIDYTVKVLVLVAFLVTARLGQKVWRSRIRLLTRKPLEPHRVPSDKWILVSTLVIHAVGYTAILIIHSFYTSQKPVRAERYVDSTGNFHTLREWETELEEYVGLIQDFFLLPQVIGNLVWQINCKPLRKLYYIGLTSVRLLPHVYDFIRSPVANPYFSEEYEFVNPRFDFYTKLGDIAIPVAAIVLAVLVYIQQRWNYEKLSEKLKFGKIRLLPVGSRAYERLPSASFEAELASGVNNREKDRDVD